MTRWHWASVIAALGGWLLMVGALLTAARDDSLWYRLGAGLVLAGLLGGFWLEWRDMRASHRRRWAALSRRHYWERFQLECERIELATDLLSRKLELASLIRETGEP